MMRDGRERRRIGIVNAVAIRFNVLIDPELLNALLFTRRDPVEAVGEVVEKMCPGEVVLSVKHFEVDR
jgi:hypothetical protein